MMNIHTTYTHKPDFRGKLHLFTVIGFCLAFLLFLGVASLFLIEIEDVIYSEGKITSELPVDVVSHLDGRVLALNVDEGGDVRKGDVIAKIDATPYEEEQTAILASIRELEAELEAKKAELATLKSNPLPKELWYAETNLKESRDRLKRTASRLERLESLRDKHAISQHEYENAEIEYIKNVAEVARAQENLEMVRNGLGSKNIEKAQRDVALVEAKIEGKRSALKFVRRYIDDCKLVAPVDGRIVNLPCKFTMYVEKGKVAANLSAGNFIKGLAYVNESLVRKVRPGQTVRISSEVFNRLEYGIFLGRVDRVYDTPIQNEKTGMAMYPVQITIDPQGRPLKLGSSAKFSIVAGYEPVLYSVFGLTKEK